MPKKTDNFLKINFKKNNAESRKILKAYLKNPNEKNIHDIRVSLRRLDASYSLLPKKSKDKKNLRKFHSSYRKFFRVNSSIRDFDVIRHKTMNHSEIGKLLEQKRESELKNAVILASYLNKLKTPKINEDKFSKSKLNKRFDKKTSALLNKIRKRHLIVINDSKAVSELHQMRKDCKKLRYLLELSQKPKSRNLVQKLKRVQKILGSIHDNDITIEFIKNHTKNQNTSKILENEIKERYKNYQKFVMYFNKNKSEIFVN